MQTHHHSENDGPVRRRQPVQPAQEFAAPVISGPQLSRLPAGRGTRGLRQQALIQAQRQHGNQFVQRMDIGGLIGGASSSIGGAAAGAGASAPSGGGSAAAPTAITDGTATVSASGGVVNIEASMINLNAPVVRADGILQTDTIIANTVVGSSYTPGAGNIM